MKNIDQLINELIDREGGYSNHPNDRGGPTNFGITEQVARAHGYAGDMRSLPRSMAVAIYKKIYWTDPNFDYIAKSMPRLAEELFDTGVNMGPTRAGMFLQRALNVLNKRATSYPDLVVDGQIGNMTLHALDVLRQQRSTMAESVLLRLVDSLQAVRYVELAEKNQTQEDFMFGWVANRVGVGDA